MGCIDFQGVDNTTWFPSGGVSTPLDMVLSISINESPAYREVIGDGDSRARSVTNSRFTTDGGLTTQNLKEAVSVLNFNVLGVLEFESTDKCLGGSGETVTITIESVVWSNRSANFATSDGTVPSLSWQSTSAALDGQTDPVTYVFA